MPQKSVYYRFDWRISEPALILDYTESAPWQMRKKKQFRGKILVYPDKIKFEGAVRKASKDFWKSYNEELRLK